MSVQNIIEQKLIAQLAIDYLNITNESSQHAGHAHGGEETHFKVEIVSPDFEGCSKVSRHQAVYKVLANELDNPIHALVVKAYSPEEWKCNQ